MSRKPRSTFWVVSTHVLTTGLAIPTLAGIASAAIILYGDVRHPLAALAVQTACAVMGYVGGTYYSLSYLRGAAEHEHWTSCTRPSIIAFAILAILGFCLSMTQLQERNTLSIGFLAIFYLIMIMVFAKITASGFAQMSHNSTELGATLNSQRKAEPSVARDAKFGRLRGGGIGLVVGFVVGLGIAVYLDHGGWEPQNGWQTRLVIAFVVGGIGGLLGMISSPSRG